VLLFLFCKKKFGSKQGLGLPTFALPKLENDSKLPKNVLTLFCFCMFSVAFRKERSFSNWSSGRHEKDTIIVVSLVKLLSKV